MTPEERADEAAKEDRQLRRLTWRTAGLSFMAALALWGSQPSTASSIEYR